MIQSQSQNRNSQSLLRVVRGGNAKLVPIADGKTGSYQTAEEMARLVRDTAVNDQELEKWAVQILKNNRLDSHSAPDEIIDAIFRYVQQIAYISDSSGQGKFDAIASARDTLAKGYGDCDDLSVLLASLLALVGFRPAFVLAKMHEGSQGFDHVYVEVATRKGRIALDPTTRKYGIGWESPRVIEKIRYPIFSNGANMAGFAGAGGLAITGAQIGLNFVPVIGPILSSLVGPLASLFHGKSPQEIAAGRNFDSLDKDVAAFFGQIHARPQVTREDYLAAQNAVAGLEHLAQQTSSVAYVRSQWAAEQPRYTAALQALAEKIVEPAVVTSGSGAQVTGSGTADMLGSVSSSLPVVLLLGGLAAILLLRR